MTDWQCGHVNTSICHGEWGGGDIMGEEMEMTDGEGVKVVRGRRGALRIFMFSPPNVQA